MAAEGMGSKMKVSTWISGLAVAAVMAVSAPVTAHAGSESGNFMVRVGASAVLPDSKVTAAGLTGEVDNQFIPSATLTYFLSKNLAVELYCCFTKHDIELNGAGKVADTWIFPPTLTLQYHFDGMGPLKPYIGAGVTWMHFFKEKTHLAGTTSVEIDDAFGFALQAGVDISMGGGWYLNADVKKIFIDTEATYSNGVIAKADIDPWIISAGIGYRFNLGDLFHRTSHEPLK